MIYFSEETLERSIDLYPDTVIQCKLSGACFKNGMWLESCIERLKQTDSECIGQGVNPTLSEGIKTYVEIELDRCSIDSFDRQYNILLRA